MKQVLTFFFSIGLLFSVHGQSGQHQNEAIGLNWQVNLSENKKTSFLFFDKAIYKDNSGFLPVYQKKVPLTSTQTIASVEIKNPVLVQLTEKELHAIRKSDKQRINDTLLPSFRIAYERKVPTGYVRILPVIKDSASGTFQKLVFFELQVNLKNIPARQTKTANYANHSVLESGNWYKIRVNETGIYKIDRNDLEAMGMNVSGIDPKNIRIYGNGAGMLPESTDVPVPDDLLENAIYVYGENDGSFDQGDYILFYGEDPTKWMFNALSERFTHKLNVYDDYTYYFISADKGPGKRIELQNSLTDPADTVISTYNDFEFHEIDEVNLLGTGRKWYEEAFEFNADYIFSKNVPGLVTSDKVRFRAAFVARSLTDSYFNIYGNGELLNSVMVNRIYDNSEDYYAREKTYLNGYYSSSDEITIRLDYIETSTSSAAWLDFIEVSYCRQLSFTGGQMSFRSAASIGDERISEFRISNAGSNLIIWNVTDTYKIKNVNGELSGSTYKIKLQTDSLLEFIAFDGSSYKAVEFVEKIQNQDLHGISNVNMIIVTHPSFLNQARELADHHRAYDDLSVEVVTTKQIFNEFSSGAQDVSAIRNFMKLLYDKATDPDELRYLLLFGDASYDYKNRIEKNTNYVLSWESEESLNPISSYVTDDYFVKLDEGEGINVEGNLDLGVGRFPVVNVTQAQAAVYKVKQYTSDSDEVMRPWRNYICFVADDEDGNLHIQQAEQLAGYVETNLKNFNVDKIYFDAYQQQSTPSGQRYPEAEAAINDRMKKGALIINYTGHGGELGWAHEQVLKNSDIQSWKNINNMPVFITATCEFSRYDDPKRVAAGENVFLNPTGGAIAMFTTTRATYAGSNLNLNKKFYRYAFRKTDGIYPRLGDVFMQSKNAAGPSALNSKKYVLLGDPALRIAYPQDSIATLKINDFQITEIPDTLKALSNVKLEGSVYDCTGQTLGDYNGVLYGTVFDKASRITTKANDDDSKPMTFYLYKNIIYKGKTNIVDGDFSISFIVPKDIAYKYGFGRISLYGCDEDSDGAGYYENFIVGGYDSNADEDMTGPVIELYMNDTSFVPGGITDNDPTLMAFVRDESGINTVGNGIGHDIIAVLDDKNNQPYILNDFYEADLGSYQSGTIEYPMSSLDEGPHTIHLKIWDVFNNSAEGSIHFVVVGSDKLIIENLMNYPNPFFHETNFVFEHNKPDTEIYIKLFIFNMQGKLEAEFRTKTASGGFNSEEIKWNGTNQNGRKLGRGIYIYKVIAETANGKQAQSNGKLIILSN